MFRDFWLPKAWGKVYKTRYYQYPMALAKDAVVIGGRSWGKSVDLESTILQNALNIPAVESLLSAFRKIHIRDRLEKVISYLTAVKYFRKFLAVGSDKTTKGAVRRHPTYEITLKNRHVIYGVSTGDDPMAIMIQGLHPRCRYIEEASAFRRDAWIKFQAARDPQMVIDRISGTTDGFIDSPFFDCDTKISKFEGKRFHVSRRMEPWFDRGIMKECVETYGGEDTNDFIQQVDAMHGEPVWGLWNEKDIMQNIDKTQHPQYHGMPLNKLQTINISAEDYKGKVPEQVLWELPPLPESDLEVILGIDAGYVSPTVVLPFFWYKGKWNLRCRINLIDKMIPDNQAEIIDSIADRYSAIIIAFDTTSADGRSVAQALANPKRREFVNKNYQERIAWVNFNSVEIVGYKDVTSFSRGKERSVYKEIHQKIKYFATDELHKKFANMFFNIYHDEDLLAEFNAEHQKQSPTGNMLIVTPSNVHLPEAFRCFAYGWWKKYGQKIDMPKRRQAEDYGFALPGYGDSGISVFGRGSRGTSTEFG
jgi:hypothetical protein